MHEAKSPVLYSMYYYVGGLHTLWVWVCSGTDQKVVDPFSCQVAIGKCHAHAPILLVCNFEFKYLFILVAFCTAGKVGILMNLIEKVGAVLLLPLSLSLAFSQ